MLNKKDMEVQAVNILKNQYESILKEREYKLNNLLLTNKDFKKAYQKVRELTFEIPKIKHDKSNHDELKNLTEELNKNNLIIDNILKENTLTKNDIKLSQMPSDSEFKMHKNFKAILSQLYLKSVNLSVSENESFDTVSFDIFSDSNKGEVKKLYEVMEKYSTNLSATNKKTVTILGDTGVGKTYLTDLMIKNAAKNLHFVIKTTAFNLIRVFKEFHSSFVKEKIDILDHFLECDLLVIDDLGTEPYYNNITQEYFYLIINERQLAGKNTIITTNLNLDDIREVYGERIFSRIANQRTALLVKLEGNDLRLKK